ncbi:MAG: SDR family NAD(P)-dependent oxidoreductase [Albimonas sp.]|uniref:SDR family NAD(P)-dependent oxidoreductase n=1 Tax=Albimonas sp. TaxID=1872425 RepID=UPI004057A6CC
MFSLEGKVAAVTGGGRGIGRGISLAMAQAGAAVVLSGRSAAPLEATAATIRESGGQALVLPGDITGPGAAAAIAQAAVETFGGLDAWVNNAGSADPGDVGPLIDIDEGQWDRVVDLNMKSAFFAAQAAARVMKALGRGGSIVNITSRSGSQPNPMTGQYGAAKAGVENLTATMAVEWGHLGIRVNGIAPGVVMTEEMTAGMSPQAAARQVESVPLGRLGRPEDVGPLCVYLASDESEWVSGTVVQLTGGSRVPVGYLAYLHKVNKARREAEAAG